MKGIKQRLLMVMDTFFKVTTGIVFVSMIYITFFWGADANMPIATFLQQILITAALCSIMNFFLDYERAVSKRGMLLYIMGHYIYENIVVLGCGIWFEWFYLSDWKMLLGMVIAIAVVFWGIIALCFTVDYKTAQKMNEKLNER